MTAASTITPCHAIFVKMDKAAKENDYKMLGFLAVSYPFQARTWQSMDHVKGHWLEVALLPTVDERLLFAESLKKKNDD
jgi:hypothetical protein